MKRFIIIAILMLVLCSAFNSEAFAQESLPRFESTECPIAVPENASIECGTLITWEDYDAPTGQTIRTAVIIIHSQENEPSREAILFTEGGPGFSSLNSVWWLANSGFNADRDIVILEQRGNIYAEPSLACDFSVWGKETEAQIDCLDFLHQQGIPLEHYTAKSIAADIDALRQAMDYETWVLLGTSYSTRLMQLVMAQNPQDVRGVILLSVSPITDTRYLHDTEHAARVLQVMFDDCSADPACAQAYPELDMRFSNLVKNLNDNPMTYEMTYPGSSERFDLEVSGDTLISFMVEDAFYAPAYPPFETAYLPLLIHELSEGNMDLLYPWAKELVNKWGGEGFSWGLYFTINCQDDAASADPEQIDTNIAAYPDLDGYLRHREELAVCETWGLDPAPPLADQPVGSDIPALILAGTYDPITPPEWSRIAVANLSSSTFVEFPSSGHSTLMDNPCAVSLVNAFLRDPGKTPDTACVSDGPRAQFILPSEVIIAPAMYEIHYGELGYSLLEETLFLGSWLTLLGAGAANLLAVLVRRTRCTKKSANDPASRWAQTLLILLALTILIWGYALRYGLQSTAATNPVILRFGLPASAWWFFITALFIGLLTLGLIGFGVAAWRRASWSLIGRIAFSIATLAAITFCAVLAKWGLFTALLPI